MRISDWSSDVCASDLDDLGADAGGVAHGDRDDGQDGGGSAHARAPFLRAARSRAAMRTRLSSSPNAPALVATGIESCPSVTPSATPGSISSRSRMPLTPKPDSRAEEIGRAHV